MERSMASEYPEMLPPFLIESYGYDEENNILRTDIDVGPYRVRRRSAQTSVVFDVSSKMTNDHLKIFETWFKYQLSGGSDWFSVALDTGMGLVEYMGRYVGKCSVRRCGPLAWIVSGKIEVDELLVMNEEELDRIIDPFLDTFMDIVFWDGFEGQLVDGMYTSPATSWPVSHSYPMQGENIISGPGVLAGLKSIAGSTIENNTSIPIETVSSSKGRVGFKWTATGSPVGQSIITLTKSM